MPPDRPSRHRPRRLRTFCRADFVNPTRIVSVRPLLDFDAPPLPQHADADADAERRHEDALLDEALDETFPASDPAARTTEPHLRG